MWRILVPGSPGQPHPRQTDARSSGEKQHFVDDDINKNTIKYCLHSVIYANTYCYMVGGLQNTGSFIELERDGMGWDGMGWDVFYPSRAPALALTLDHHVE